MKTKTVKGWVVVTKRGRIAGVEFSKAGRFQEKGWAEASRCRLDRRQPEYAPHRVVPATITVEEN
mgnify:FL=1